ncbi:thioredoxin domain-containing protein [Microbacterium sp. NPDC089189]|uniref:DsbA family protein n=1 Tax=Microbacterium sp. NPDC089189 TaxID=3154972 RepID=UPI003426AB7D
MSNDDPSNVPSSSDRREAVREKAQIVRARHARAGVIRMAALAVGGLAVVGAVIAGVVVAVSSSTSAPQASPSNISDGGIAVTSVTGLSLGAAAVTATPTPAAEGEATPAPTPTSASTADIRVYVDYLAPGAKQFELANAQQLSGWVTEGAAQLSYHPVAMLTAKSNGTKYSLRAAGAAACVATYSPDSVFAFHHELLVEQPEASTDGLSDEQLVDAATAAGVVAPAKAQVSTCIEKGEFMSWAKSATDQAIVGLPGTDGLTLTGTPMILVNGELYQGALDDPKEFAQFVLTTASDAYYSTPTPTPTQSETPAS